ncbi:MAG: S9 family peptidase, partial [Candidatus Dormibacteraeota bacterium]|nr:S9 family peptidase [Candidatus Dormibacteraeota bacterium]
RERAREASSGIVRFSADTALHRAVVDVNGAVFAVDLDTGEARRLPACTPAVDPRMEPNGATVAYVSGGALRVVGWDGTADRPLLEPESDDVTYGLAEFVAAEEMDREEGFWWSPDGSMLVAERADISDVHRIHIADPANPAAEPLRVAYPFAGTANAAVSLILVALDGRRRSVQWDAERFEYLAAVRWTEHGLLIVVQTRDQRTLRVLRVDVATGATSVVREDTDDHWVDIVNGVPAHLDDGSLVWTADIGGATRLVVDGDPVTADAVQVRAVLDVDGGTVLFSASDDPTLVDVWTWSRADGAQRFDCGDPRGVAAARRAGGTTVIASRCLEHPGVSVKVCSNRGAAGRIESRAETPLVTARPHMLQLGERELRAALFFPTGHAAGGRPLPVLMDSYGGPAAQRVLAAHAAQLVSQWFADQGFAVLVIDGRGTPGRGPEWSRTIRGNRADPVLEDQIDGLHAAAEQFSDLDLEHVGIRGWSYGGYLAALAVLRRPDVFHAAVAGAPVTDQRLYDTHYTERYLGHPDAEPESYEQMSLIADAPGLRRPLLLVHGLSDDNVLVANTLRLSAALFAAGRPHSVLPLPGVTHTTNRVDIASTLPLLELDFLRRALGLLPAEEAHSDTE